MYPQTSKWEVLAVVEMPENCGHSELQTPTRSDLDTSLLL